MQTEFLNYTKNKRKENYDFLSQFMKNHQIKIDSLIPQENQSFVTSEMTDQVIGLVNNKNTIQSQATLSQNTPIQSPKQFTEQKEFIDETPIIQEIDSIISKIRTKYNAPIKTISPKKNEINIDEISEEDFISQIRQRANQNKKSNQSSNKQQNDTFSNPIQQLQQSQKKKEQIQIKSTPKEISHSPLKETEIIQKNNITLEEKNDSNKKESSIKNQVKRLKETFKPPIISNKPIVKIQQENIKQNILINENQINEQQDNLIITSQFAPLENQEDDYFTPVKKMDVYSQLSYSQSASILNSEIKENQQEVSKKQDIFKDPILSKLIQEELELMQRLEFLQKQLNYEQKSFI